MASTAPTAAGGAERDGEAGLAAREVLDHLVALRSLSWRHAMALKDGRNQTAMLERETARARAAQEQFLAVTLSGLDEVRAALRRSEAERAALADRLHAVTGRNRRLATRSAALAADLRARAADVDAARHAGAAAAAEGDLRLRDAAARVGELEARLAVAEASTAAAARREDDSRSERSRSRWIRLGRALGLTKL